jgi:NitT/TauT family transport system substrate-binding protein
MPGRQINGWPAGPLRGRRARVAVAVGLSLALTAVACGSGKSTSKATTTTTAGSAGVTSSGVNAAGGFPADRCTKNKKAGKILFLTSFDYAAAASIIDVVVAKQKGWFDAVCLDVQLQAGFSTDNVAVVASNRAQMTSLGSFSEVAVANSKDAKLVAVAVEGKTSIEELLVRNGRGVTQLTDLSGKTVGIKGAIPYSIRAMLAKAGVKESTIKQVQVGFNPAVLFETELDALPVYKSNEPGQLDAAGYAGKYTVFDPKSQSIPASFAVLTTSRSFADQNPTAVSDFLRATIKGFEWAESNPDEAVQITLKLSDPKQGFTANGEKFRWSTESKLVRSTTPAGKVVGAIDKDLLTAEEDTLIQLGVVAKGAVDVTKAYDASFLDDVTKGGQLVWYG